VARPAALSGFAGTMSSQFVLACAPAAAWVPVADGDGDALADALAPSADSLIVATGWPPDTASVIPSASPSAMGTASGTMIRAEPRPRRRAFPLLANMPSTSCQWFFS
jgi:hypothetical protein